MSCHTVEMELNLSADEVLSTTRAVRKRLDFDKPVSREVIEECLQLALQAPTGSNTQGWQWVFVTDPAKKQALADIYAKNFALYRNFAAATTFEEGDLRGEQKDRVTDSAQYLADNFHRVPVLMIPCITGNLDGVPSFAGASMWGSILPAVWSFMLALRARGLGSAWTTLHLAREREVAELLGIPYDTCTQAGLFPIAYTKGTDFQPASRVPATDVTHWNTW